MPKYKETPSTGERHRHHNAVDAVKPANSGLKDAGFTRFIQRFNTNADTDSPSTSAGNCRGSMQQKIKIPKGIGGKI